jgi:uncharacterized protein (DUF1330 family)
MAAYIIFIRDRTLQPSEMEIYAQKAGSTLDGHHATVRAFYGPYEVLEGQDAEGVVILEFPTFKEAKAWYDSPAYTEARAHRQLGSEYRVIIAEGVDAPQS